ncbi:hypothetical protein U1872_19115 [Sphingomonas sp. RB3P16]|uniref:hypothetical protein n=1 Tax=Parasphingomonas frigoris TaxID=3096163 RepID=UPI002FC6F368
MHRLSLLVATSLTALGTPALAQNSVTPQPLPGLDSFSLPSNRPTPRSVPTPEPTTNPRPVETATPERVAPPAAVPTVRTTPAPRPSATPARTPPTARATPTAERTPAPRASASATPEPVAPAVRVVAPTATPAATPTPAPTSPPTPQPSAARSEAPAPASTGSAWLWPAVGGALALIVATGLGLWWRRRAAPDTAIFDEDSDAMPVAPGDAEPETVVSDASPVPAVVRPPVAEPAPPVMGPAARAAITLELTPKRAGTNLLSGAVEYTIVLRNTGEAMATGIRLDIRLLSVGSQQDAVIAALFAAPIAQPKPAPFDLPPGTAVELGGMAMHPKDALDVIEAGGKTLFVPVLSINALYDWAGGSGQTARSYVIGIDRGAGGKLAPFRLDTGARMYDTVSAIEYTVSATR